MSEVKWIKITTGMFDDEKIDFIESLPEADTVLICWIKLLTLAGKSNMSGHIMLTESIPYTPDMLAHKFKRPLNTVKMALETFTRLGMITMEEGKPIYINNWEKHQNIDGMEKIKEQNRLRNIAYRQRKKEQLLLQSSTEEHNRDVTNDITHDVTRDADMTNHDGEMTHLDIDLDKEIDQEINTPKDNRRKRVYDENSSYMKMAVYLKEKILTWKPNAKIPDDLNKWADEFRKIHELDGRTKEQIKKVIDFATTDSFWQVNILSAKKLRDKFDTLDAQSDIDSRSEFKVIKGGNRNYQRTDQLPAHIVEQMERQKQAEGGTQSSEKTPEEIERQKQRVQELLKKTAGKA